jgi:hypothetical protein
MFVYWHNSQILEILCIVNIINQGNACSNHQQLIYSAIKHLFIYWSPLWQWNRRGYDILDVWLRLKIKEFVQKNFGVQNLLENSQFEFWKGATRIILNWIFRKWTVREDRKFMDWNLVNFGDLNCIGNWWTCTVVVVVAVLMISWV